MKEVSHGYLPSGDVGVNTTVRLMIDLAKQDVNHPSIQAIVKRFENRKSDYSKLKGYYQYILRNIRYVKDPKGKEYVRSPKRLLESGIGDCDCLSTLWMCLGMASKASNGRKYKQAVKVVSVEPKNCTGNYCPFEHVYMVTYIPELQLWLPFDPVMDLDLGIDGFGIEIGSTLRRKYYSVS